MEVNIALQRFVHHRNSFQLFDFDASKIFSSCKQTLISLITCLLDNRIIHTFYCSLHISKSNSIETIPLSHLYGNEKIAYYFSEKEKRMSQKWQCTQRTQCSPAHNQFMIFVVVTDVNKRRLTTKLCKYAWISMNFDGLNKPHKQSIPFLIAESHSRLQQYQIKPIEFVCNNIQIFVFCE